MAPLYTRLPQQSLCCRTEEAALYPKIPPWLLSAAGHRFPAVQRPPEPQCISLHEGRKYPIQHTRYEAVPGAPSSKGVGHSAGALFQITRLHRENPFPVHPAKALQARQTYRLPRQYLTYFHLSITAQCIQKGACLVYSLPVLCIRLRTVGNTPSHLEVSGSILNNKGPDHNT